MPVMSDANADASAETIDFVHTGPNTVGGRYLRRFWQPVYLSRQLRSGQAVPIRILGEDFTLYRGESGTAHLVGPRCPHRRTLLSTGWVEEDSIRCVYHGWKFDPQGKCMEQPAEPMPFCHKVYLESYPTEEHLGLIFGYFGEAAQAENGMPTGPTPPPLPRWPELEDASSITTMERIPCNYFQSAENIVDDCHVRFAHRGTHLSGSARAGIPTKIRAEETSFGLTITLHHRSTIAKNHFLMPNSCYIRDYLEQSDSQGVPRPVTEYEVLFWYVPIDDVSHYHIYVSTTKDLVPNGAKAFGPTRIDAPDSRSVEEQVLEILAGKKRLQDLGPRHPEMVRIQDGVSIVGQGAIADRTQEQLGRTDVGIILLRKLWLRELRQLAAGKPLADFQRPADLAAL